MQNDTVEIIGVNVTMTKQNKLGLFLATCLSSTADEEDSPFLGCDGIKKELLHYTVGGGEIE